MHNIHALYWPTIQHKMHTWELKGKKTWIDQVYISRETITNGCVKAAEIESFDACKTYCCGFSLRFYVSFYKKSKIRKMKA